MKELDEQVRARKESSCPILNQQPLTLVKEKEGTSNIPNSHKNYQ